MGILLKEHFNRWYSLKSYYISVTLLDLPISVKTKHREKKKSLKRALFFRLAISTLLTVYLFQFIGTTIFTVLIYTITSQPFELSRFSMFLAISIIVTIVGQSIGLMVGAWFNVVVSTFVYISSNLKFVRCVERAFSHKNTYTVTLESSDDLTKFDFPMFVFCFYFCFFFLFHFFFLKRMVLFWRRLSPYQ